MHKLNLHDMVCIPVQKETLNIVQKETLNIQVIQLRLQDYFLNHFRFNVSPFIGRWLNQKLSWTPKSMEMIWFWITIQAFPCPFFG